MPVDVGLQRAHARAGSGRCGSGIPRAWRSTSGCATGFLTIARDEPERCAIIDAKGTQGEVEAAQSGAAGVESRLAVHG